MNFDIKNIFGAAKKPPVKIRLLSDLSIPVDGVTRHVDTGEEVEVSHAVFNSLDPSDYEITSVISPTNGVQIADPTPAREDPAPLPNGWDKLPSCFADWHRMTSDLVCARKHITAIRETRRSVFGTDADFSDVEGTFLAGGITGGLLERTNYYSTLQPFNLSDPTTKKLARYLAAGLAKAEDYLERLKEKTSIPLQRAFYECGMHHLNQAEKLQTVVDDINDLGYQIFTHRVSALGLHDFHVRRLYGGSSDFQKYSQAPVYVGGACFAGTGDDGTMRVYSDLPVPSSASFLQRDTERLKELTPLLAQARKELAATLKAAAKAA